MPENKMRSKEEILGEQGLIPYDAPDHTAILEALLDIRDILDERMSKGVEISGLVEETNEVTMLGRPVVNARTGIRVREKDLKGKAVYIDLGKPKKGEKND